MIGPSKRTLKNMEGLHPSLIKVIMRAYQITPIDFGIAAPAVRTQEQQNDLYAQGRTKEGPIVTWRLDSKHIIQNDGYGHAYDFAAFENGKLSWDEKLYPPIAKAMKTAAKELGIDVILGIDWKTPDPGHVELG